MRFDLARMSRRNSRRPILLPRIQSTQAQADGLGAIYQRVVQRWREGQPTIMAVYQRTLLELQTDSASDLRETLDAIADEIRRLVLQLTPDLRDWALRVEQVQRGKWIRSILSAIDIDLSTVLTANDMRETVEAVIEWNVSLVRDVSEETRRRISNSVFTGVQQRKPARQVAKEIREAVGMARARSIRIAADQSVKLGERLNQARQEQAGLTHFKWRHSGKKHPRPHHEARDGKIYPWEGEGSIAPDDRPGQPPFCGCTGQGVVMFGDE